MKTFIKLDVLGSEDEYFLTMLEEPDAEAIYKILSLDEVNNSLLRVPKPYTFDLAQAWLVTQTTSHKKLLSLPTVSERRKALFSPNQAHPQTIPIQAIRHASPSGPLIGCVILIYRPQSDPSAKVVDLGYYLHPLHQGKRVMLPAAKEALKWAKEEFGITEVCGSADYANVRSGSLMERIASETCVGGKKEVRRGEGTFSWPGFKVGKEQVGEVERKCFTWSWMV